MKIDIVLSFMLQQYISWHLLLHDMIWCISLFWTETHFRFCILIQIWWKFNFALIQIVVQWSLGNHAHVTTTVLSWHVQNFVSIWLSAIELHQTKLLSNWNGKIILFWLWTLQRPRPYWWAMGHLFWLLLRKMLQDVESALYFSQCWCQSLVKWTPGPLCYRLNISQSNITWYWTQHAGKNTKILFRLWTHKRHPILCPYGQAMGRLFWVLLKKCHKISRVHCISIDADANPIVKKKKSHRTSISNVEYCNPLTNSLHCL